MNNNLTPRGTLCPSQLAKHKLKENTVVEHFMDNKIFLGHGHQKKLKTMIESLATYRLMSHKVLAPNLARPLVLAAGYFCDANKPEFRRRDARPGTVAEVAAQES